MNMMKLKALNYLALSVLLALIFPATIFAQTTTSPVASCGPFMDTYQVTSLNGVEGNGIRCVKFTDRKSLRAVKANAPVFAWYGEGIWNDCTYRHIGHAFATPKSQKNNELTGYASDIWGNGECANGNFPGNLTVKIIDRDTIQVTGSWGEEWKRVAEMNYSWLANPLVCGDHLTSYTAYSLDDAITGNLGKFGKGLRCELRLGKFNTTWVGFGYWGTETYSHLGTKNSNGQVGSSDFCKAGEACYTAAYGDLKRIPSPTLQGLIIRGWNDIWKK